MNIKKLSLSTLVIAGLVVGGTPTKVNAQINLGYIGKAAILSAILITYRLESKESVKNPETKHTWSDIKDGLFAGDFAKAWAAFDERFIGQKGKATAIKITEGDKEIKGTSATPATGICGKSQEHLLKFGKSALDTTKVLAAPAIIAGLFSGNLSLMVKDGEIKFTINPTVLELLGFGTKAKKGEAA